MSQDLGQSTQKYNRIKKPQEVNETEKNETLQLPSDIKKRRKSLIKKELDYKDGSQYVEENIDIAQWRQEEIKLIFQYYEQYGTHWSQLEKKFQGRNQNALKNKFYGTLKFLLRNIFKELGLPTGNKIRNLPATRVIDIYDGRKEFKQYKGLLKQLLQKMEYQISRKLILQFIETKANVINQIYKITFPEKKEQKKQSQEPENNLIVTEPAQQELKFSSPMVPNILPYVNQPFFSYGRPAIYNPFNTAINYMQYPFWNFRPGPPFQ